MKRICMVLVLAVITAAVCGCGSGKQEASTNIVSEFSDIIKTYYIQKDTGAEELAGDMFSGDIYKYLNLKISDCRHRAEQENIQKQNYTVKTKLLERIDSEDYKTLKYQAVSEVVYIVYENESGRIVNFAVPGDNFDTYVRGITDSDVSLDDYEPKAFVMTDEIRSRINKLS